MDNKPLLDSNAPKRTEEEELEMERALAARTDPVRGLSTAQVTAAFEEYGPNELAQEEGSIILKFLSYFTGPMALMIWLACLIEVVKAVTTGDGWPDFAVLLALQIVNGTVGFIEEHNAGNAIAALKERLAPQARVCRNGVWQTLPARELVPGDLLELKLGDVLPADCILGPGLPFEVDQSALTGESLPTTVHPGGKLFMGSAVKRGESKAIVVATGKLTFFGKAAEMMNITDAQGRFQKILFKITLWLLAVSIVLTAIIFVKLMVSNDKTTTSYGEKHKSKFLRAISVCIVLLVASIPIAMQVVCTSTMAVGSRRLAQRKVIVARLSAIEELAGMTILCSDKTGTLTQNKLSLNDPVTMGDMDAKELVFYSALAAKREEGSQDAIDFCITQAVPRQDRERLAAFREVDFVPFNPTDKRVEATVAAPDQSIFKVTKGAPQVILNMAHNADEIRGRVDAAVQELADRGYRALGVAISYTAPDEPEKWEFQGVLSVFDPPRTDTKHTIEEAHRNGVEVKMITGDQTAIAIETCRQLGMGTKILNTNVLNGDYHGLGASLEDVILQSNGFAEVMPEHKFQIVQSLRTQGFVVGMTGDGVNDAPALKRADIGIAVEGATDAAKAAADIVLIEPGLSVIIEAIFRSRKIFQRMRNYCIYRIACTIQLLFFFFFAVLTIDPNSSTFYGDENFIDHASSFTLPVISLVVITILNDGTIITIAHDKVIPEDSPQKWNLTEVVIVSAVLGLVACLSSMIILFLSMQARGEDFLAKIVAPGVRCPFHAAPFINADKTACFPNKELSGSCDGMGVGDKCPEPLRFISWGEVQTMMYLKISLSDFFTVFAARTRSWFLERRPGYALAIACVFATSLSTIFSCFWPFPPESAKYLNMAQLRHSWAALLVWVYVLIWFVGQDICKVVCYWVLNLMNKDEADAVSKRAATARIANAIDSDARRQRVTGGGPTREASRLGAGTGAGGHKDVAAMQARINSLEQEVTRLSQIADEVAEIKAMMSRK